MIDRGDIRQAIDRYAISGLHCRALVAGQFEHKWAAWLQNSKEAGGTVRDWCMSRVTAIIRSGYCISSAVGIIFADNAVQTGTVKSRKHWLTTAAITDMQMRQRDVAALDAKYAKELADAKLKMMLCVMMLPLVVVSFAHQSGRQCVKPPPPPAWIMQPPSCARHLPDGIISPSKRGWSLCKNNWKEPRSILIGSADRVAHIDGQLMQLLWAIHTRFQRSINA